VYHPTTRVLAILELLQTHGRLSGSDLAARLGVNGRTLRRYISRLEDLGIPIAVEHGRHGGYMLVAGYKLPPMLFTDEEALALSVGLLAARPRPGRHRAGRGGRPGQARARDAGGPAAPGARGGRHDGAGPPASARFRGRRRPGRAQRGRAGGTARTPRLSLGPVRAHRARVRSVRPGLPRGRWYAVGHCHLRKGTTVLPHRPHPRRARHGGALRAAVRTSMPSATSSSPWPRSPARSRWKCS
jgi:biotin operon repressor